MKIISLLTLQTLFEASMIKGRLENEGIKAFLAHEHFSTLMPHLSGILGSGIQVMIFDKDLEKARAILATEKPEVITCPDCGSSDIIISLGKHKKRKVIAILLSLFSATPFNNINNVYRCRKCVKEFG